jgi:hypothetical protein
LVPKDKKKPKKGGILWCLESFAVSCWVTISVLYAHCLIWINGHLKKNNFKRPSVEINYFWNQLIKFQLMMYQVIISHHVVK